MGAGVSLSLPRKGIPGDGILLFVASDYLKREHVYLCEENYSGGFDLPDSISDADDCGVLTKGGLPTQKGVSPSLTQERVADAGSFDPAGLRSVVSSGNHVLNDINTTNVTIVASVVISGVAGITPNADIISEAAGINVASNDKSGDFCPFMSENSVRPKIQAISGSAIADLAEYSGRQVPDPFRAVLSAQLCRNSCVDLGYREMFGHRGATFAGTSGSKRQNPRLTGAVPEQACQTGDVPLQATSFDLRDLRESDLRAPDPGVKNSLNLGFHEGVKATAGEQLSRRRVHSSGVLMMPMPSIRSSGLLINPGPFHGTNSGQLEGTASAMRSSGEASKFVYDPLIQSVRPSEQKGFMVLDFQPVRADLGSTLLGYELVNSSIVIVADLHFSTRDSADPGPPVYVDRPVWLGHGHDCVVQEVGELVSPIRQGEHMSVTVDGALISVVSVGLDLTTGGRFILYWMLWVLPIPN